MVLAHDVFTSERTQDIKISEDVSFDSMLLSSNTLNGLKSSGFYVPSPIQLHGIPLGKCGFDLLLEAKSGTGKTAVFSVIALEKINLDKGVQTLILAPTREIASQICDVLKTIGAYFKGLSVEVVMGGLPFAEDVEKFKKQVHVVVGSPGRLHYLIRGKHIDVSSVRLMVLDEADKLVEKSFLPDINYIFSQLPNQKQIIMSSATYTENVKTIMSNYVQNAHHICPDSSSILLGIEQNVQVVQGHVNIVKQTKNRYIELNQILSKKQFKQCLVFCNYQVRVGEVHRMLNKDKWPADKLHGQQEQTDRLIALKILQNYQCRILVTTDLAARGIDASNVDLVINFEIPYDWQTYLHRIGRAGRFGSYGSAITIICEGEEEKKFKKLLGSINIPFQLKHLKSQEPFLLEDISHKEEESQPEVNESERKLGIKETHEELWKMLSVDSSETITEMHDFQTFERLCESFEHANRDSTVNEIESFSDLLSSFQNHKIKSNEKSNYKPMEVNKLIIPCNIFNRDIILQSFQKYESGISLAEIKENNNDNKCEKASGYKKFDNSVSKLGSTHDDDTSDESDREISENKYTSSIQNREKESCKPKYNVIANGSRHQQTETEHHEDLYLPITSRNSKLKTGTRSKIVREASSSKNESSNNHSKKNIDEISCSKNHSKRLIEKASCSKTESSNNHSKILIEEASCTKNEKRDNHSKIPIQEVSCSKNERINNHSKRLIEEASCSKNEISKPHSKIYIGDASSSQNENCNNYSIRYIEHKEMISNKIVFTKTNVENDEQPHDESDSIPHKSDYNDNAIVSDCQSEYNDDEKSLLAANLPTAFGKSKQRYGNKSKKSRDVSVSKKIGGNNQNKINNEYKNQLPKTRTVLTTANVKQRTDSVYESSDDESVSYSSLGSKKVSKSHCPQSNMSTKHDGNSHEANNHSNGNRYIKSEEKRQQQFDLWYQQLQAHMQMIERSVYIEVMSSPYY
ncbi:DEAD box ATP-dependent RNA helicase [Operophtera brumata]|uniref:RNA helicase n=1 Tax=Operophtera brumata TaxID=104452 RepID=A0A0L7L1R7_OPEBR|nr:DEAD box ATP-dependent RNA helicase [Operophtera brumata]